MNQSALPPSTAYHRFPIRITNKLIAGLNVLGLARTEFDAQSFMNEAREKTGLQDYGDTGFLPRLELLVRALDEEADLNPVGRMLQKQAIVSILKNRLYITDLLKRHPEILERSIPDPVIIVGLARSGTTRLHRLLAADERFLHVKAWESMKPAPYPGSFTEAVDPRVTEIENGLKAVLYMSPQMAAVHPLGAHEVEEEIGLIMQAFSTQMFEVQTRIPSFAEHLMTHAQDEAYEYMHKLMKVISWFRKDPEDSPWVMKSPQHMQDLDALIRVFPNAKILCTHRDPVKAVGSACSMTWNSIVRDTDTADPFWVGQEWLEKTDRMLRKTLRVREEMVAPGNQHDVLYADITADWRAALQNIYDFIGMELNPAAVAGMEAWLAQNAQHKHGAHKYSLADFGLSKEVVDAKLMYYRERFSIPYEVKNPHKSSV